MLSKVIFKYIWQTSNIESTRLLPASGTIHFNPRTNPFWLEQVPWTSLAIAQLLLVLEQSTVWPINLNLHFTRNLFLWLGKHFENKVRVKKWKVYFYGIFLGVDIGRTCRSPTRTWGTLYFEQVPALEICWKICTGLNSQGSFNISKRFLNPYTVRIKMVGWSGPDENYADKNALVLISLLSLSECLCRLHVASLGGWAGSGNSLRCKDLEILEDSKEPCADNHLLVKWILYLHPSGAVFWGEFEELFIKDSTSLKLSKLYFQVNVTSE